jgi:hypothetical protein
MLRRTFDVMMGLSLLLFSATGYFWVRSYSVTDNPVRYTLEQRGKYWVVRGYSIVSAEGAVRVHRSRWLAAYDKYPWDNSTKKFLWSTRQWSDIWDGVKEHLPPAPQLRSLPRDLEQNEREGREWTVTFPYWWAAIVFALLPVWWFKRRVFRRKYGRGFEITTETAK